MVADSLAHQAQAGFSCFQSYTPTPHLSSLVSLFLAVLPVFSGHLSLLTSSKLLALILAYFRFSLFPCSCPNYTVSQNKQDTKLLPITSPTINRFFEILSLLDSVGNSYKKIMFKYSTTP